MSDSNLKDLVRKDLNDLKQKQLEEAKLKNEQLKEITIYTRSASDKLNKNILTHLDKVGIKYIEKNLEIHPEITSAMQINSHPVVTVNDQYVAFGRDFQTPSNLEAILQTIASEDFVDAPFEVKVLSSLKNLSMNMMHMQRNLGQQLGPIIKLMNQIQAEEDQSNKPKIGPKAKPVRNIKKGA